MPSLHATIQQSHRVRACLAFTLQYNSHTEFNKAALNHKSQETMAMIHKSFESLKCIFFTNMFLSI